MSVNEQWKHLAVEIGHSVRRAVNTPKMIGTEDETGYILMFFNTDHHDGKSTLISSCVDNAELRQLLQAALDNVGGPLASIVEPGGKH